MNSTFITTWIFFKINCILGAFADESTGIAEVDFQKTFGEKDIQLRVFPQGAAFYNCDKSLYVTGGQEI